MRTRLCSFHCPHQEEEDEAALAASWRKGNLQRRWELGVSAGLASFRIGGGLGLSLLILVYIYYIRIHGRISNILLPQSLDCTNPCVPIGKLTG